jgi:tetratricopeptide (TPR) repeat protein
VQRSLLVEPDPRSILLMSRILRSLGHSRDALTLVRASSIRDKWLAIEELMLIGDCMEFPELEAYGKYLREEYPSDDDVWCAVVSSCFLAGKPTVARQLLDKWAEFASESVSFYKTFGEVAFHFDELHNAERAMSFAIELEPENAELRAELAFLWLKNGNWEMAMQDAKCALHLDPESEHGWLAISRLTNGDEQARAAEKAEQIRRASTDLSNVELMFFRCPFSCLVIPRTPRSSQK